MKENPYKGDKKPRYRLGKIFTNHKSNKGLIFRIHKELSKFKGKKKANQKRNWEEDMKRYCTEDTIQDGRQAQQMMTYIIFHQRNANENHTDHDTPIRMIR